MVELMAMRYGNKSASVKQSNDTFIVEMYENSRRVGSLTTLVLDEAKSVADNYVTSGSSPQFLSEHA
jgi:hypothetical protein